MNNIDYNTFASRAKKNNIMVQKLDTIYPIADTRCWTAIVNPEKENILVTFNVNRYQYGNAYFDIIGSDNIITDVYIDDVYDVIDSLTGNKETLINYNYENVE